MHDDLELLMALKPVVIGMSRVQGPYVPVGQ